MCYAKEFFSVRETNSGFLRTQEILCQSKRKADQQRCKRDVSFFVSNNGSPLISHPLPMLFPVLSPHILTSLTQHPHASVVFLSLPTRGSNSPARSHFLQGSYSGEELFADDAVVPKVHIYTVFFLT